MFETVQRPVKYAMLSIVLNPLSHSKRVGHSLDFTSIQASFCHDIAMIVCTVGQYCD